MAKEVAKCPDCGRERVLTDLGVCSGCYDYNRYPISYATRYRYEHREYLKGVYFIQGVKKNGDYYGLIKIGISVRPLERLATLQKQVRRNLEIIGVEIGGRERERRLHMMFAPERKYFEWFKPSDVLLDYIFSSTLGIDEFLQFQECEYRAINERARCFELKPLSAPRHRQPKARRRRLQFAHTKARQRNEHGIHAHGNQSLPRRRTVDRALRRADEAFDPTCLPRCHGGKLATVSAGHGSRRSRGRGQLH